MPELNWVGKDKVITHHLDVPFRVLERQYSFDESGQHDEDNGSPNMIIHGDNLEALKALLPTHEGKIDCIYIDPPYNTGNEGWVYNDNVNDPQIRRWLGEVVGKEGEDLSRHDKWLCMMYPRLRLIHRLMADHAVLFVSIDDNECAKLINILDEIFGERNRLGTLIQDKGNSKADTADIQRNHEYILVYRKRIDLTGLGQSGILIDRSNTIRRVLQDERGWYRLGDPITTRADGGVLSARPNLGFSIYYSEETCDFIAVEDYDKVAALNPNSSLEIYNDRQDLLALGYCPIRPPMVRGQLGAWTWQLDKVNSESSSLHIQKTRNGSFQVRKRIDVSTSNVQEIDGEFFEVAESASNVRSILSFPTSDGTTLLNEVLGVGKFNNPKNCAMLEYLISLVDKKDAVVLDSFAGSGTTAQAVLNLNKRDNGDRKFILIELGDYSDSVTAERVKRTIRGYKSQTTQTHVLFDHKLTAAALKKGEALFAEAEAVAKDAQGKYTKVSKPKLVTSVSGKTGSTSLQVVAVQEHDKDVSGTGGAFSYFELGDHLFVEGSLNPAIDTAHVLDYVWFTETGSAGRRSENPPHRDYLGEHQGTAYFFAYDAAAVTTLDYEYLAGIPVECGAESYVMYADLCTLSDRELAARNITFKKIPRDITRL